MFWWRVLPGCVSPRQALEGGQFYGRMAVAGSDHRKSEYHEASRSFVSSWERSERDLPVNQPRAAALHLRLGDV